MSRMFVPFTAAVFFFLILPLPLEAQTPVDTEESPPWARDLRRAEIVAFGTFPFTLFLATFSMDTYRASQHGWDSRYAPWPFKPAGSIDMSTDEYLLSIGLAAAGSVALSLTDYFIVLAKRRKYEKALKNLPQGTPIIRNPWPAAESAVPSPENEQIQAEIPQGGR